MILNLVCEGRDKNEILNFSYEGCKNSLASGSPPIYRASFQGSRSAATTTADAFEDAGTSTDFFVMLGSDFDRPGLLPKANYNIGIGHTFGFLKKDPFGDELTFAYTYEDAGAGFWHSDFGSHTESFGVMKNFGLPKTKVVTGYTWIQAGISSSREALTCRITSTMANLSAR